ncbi:LEA type 2 family protein [Haliangium sp.]|uniref:LEA type 2 family protein n=1 Tax=Haliangium sp. TaxID=2663208 RepID=UPI003D0CB72D
MTCRALTAFAFLVLALVPGCFRHWVDFEVRRITAVRVTAVHADGFDAVVESEVENPNRVGASVHDVAVEVRSGGALLGTGVVPGPVPAPARSRFVIAAPLRVRYADLPADLPARVADGRLPIEVEARLVAETAVGTLTMALRSEGAPEIADALEVAIEGAFQGGAVRIQSIRVTDVGLLQVRLGITLALDNRFPFPITVRRARFALEVDGRHFGTGTLADPVTLPAAAALAAEVEVVAYHWRAGRAALAVLRGANRFRGTGTLWIEPIGGVAELPFDVTADGSVFAISGG